MATVSNKIAMLNSNFTPITSTSPFPIKDVSGIVSEPHDYIELVYTGSNVTQKIHKLGGASGTVVATLTIGYNGSDPTSITKT